MSSSAARAAGVTAAVVSLLITLVVAVVISPPWGLGTVLLAVALTAYLSGYAVAAA